MTTYKIFKSKYFILVMCIFIVIAAWSTLVFRAADNTGDTHLFAVHFLEFISPVPTPSLNKKNTPRFVAWIQQSEGIAENTFDYFVNNTFVNLFGFMDFVFPIGQAIKNAFFENGKTMFYLRI